MIIIKTMPNAYFTMQHYGRIKYFIPPYTTLQIKQDRVIEELTMKLSFVR